MTSLYEWRKKDLQRINQEIREWGQQEYWHLVKLIRKWQSYDESIRIVRAAVPESFRQAAGMLLIEKNLRETRDKILTKIQSCATLQTKPDKNIGGLSKADIEKARNYPIENLFPEAKGHMVKCPFHDDKIPSASIKKGWLRCFVCGTRADSIKVYQHLHGADFVTAVRALI